MDDHIMQTSKQVNFHLSYNGVNFRSLLKISSHTTSLNAISHLHFLIIE